MNVTTKKSECDTRQQIHQLEVAIEHARAAASAASRMDSGNASFVEVRFPSYQFRETLKVVRPDAGEHQGRWVFLDAGTTEGGKAACIVLGHYHSDEHTDHAHFRLYA